MSQALPVIGQGGHVGQGKKNGTNGAGAHGAATTTSATGGKPAVKASSAPVTSPSTTAAATPAPITTANTAEIARVDPVDLRSLPSVPRTTAAELARAVKDARIAQDAWREQSFQSRAAALKRAAKAMLDQRSEAIALVREEMGKLEIEGLFNEGLGPLDVLSGWISVVERAGQRKKVGLNPLAFPGKSAYVDQVPRGVIGVIAPWNFPISGLYRSVYPALLTGNAVLLKPSEYTPRSSEWFIQKLAAELPAGLVHVIHGDGAEGRALVDSGIDACVFTGSPKAGRAVSIRCAELGIPCSAEMGGKDAAIVLDDCDRERTVAGITHWALSNVGQSCGAIEVALVEEHIADDFVARLGRAFTRLHVGSGATGEYAEIGPLANARQLAIVKAQVEDAIAKGATLVCGGEVTGRGYGFQPTLLDHCTEEMQVVRDETFGPVLAVVRVDGAADAVRRVNRGRYGLGASIWTRDYARAERLAGRLEVGVVDVNNHSFTGAIAALPWSGTRETGFGVANSEHSLHTFVRPRAVVIDKSEGPEPFWMPFDKGLWEMGNLLSEAQLFRLLGAYKLPLLMRRRVQAIKSFFRR